MSLPTYPSHKPDHKAAFETKSEAYDRAKKEAWWLSLWQTRSWRSAALWPLSILYKFVVIVRRLSYRLGVFDAYSAPVPVVIVGGILVGGVGKTPVVGALAKSLVKAGYHPAIVARGYGSTAGRVQHKQVTLDSSAKEVGDEPLLHLISTNLPVWVGANRAATISALCEAHPECDVILCDDGLQHYRLARDIEIVVMDARGLGNGWCLPAGPLREPSTRLSIADAVVWHQRCMSLSEVKSTESPEHDGPSKPNHFSFKSYISDAYNLFDSTYRLPLSYFSGKDILSIAGIAQPDVFFKMLKAHNIQGRAMALPDHFAFDSDFLKQMDLHHVKHVLMTEKDAVKYRQVIKNTADYRDRFWVVPLEVLATPELQRLESFVMDKLKVLKK